MYNHGPQGLVVFQTAGCKRLAEEGKDRCERYRKQNFVTNTMAFAREGRIISYSQVMSWESGNVLVYLKDIINIRGVRVLIQGEDNQFNMRLSEAPTKNKKKEKNISSI